MSKSPHLYRILSYRHVIKMFADRELYFASPRSWDDPYEKALVHKYSDALFAQCWCKKAVSDAMWRIYSTDRTSLRIQTTRHQLKKTLTAAQGTEKFDFLIEDVQYKTAKLVDAHISQIAKDLRIEYNVRRAEDALLVKRDAFDHEEEVRVIVHDQTATDAVERSGFKVRIDPHELIDSIYFDPRADDAFMDLCRNYIECSIGFKGKIGKSALYRLREPEVVK